MEGSGLFTGATMAILEKVLDLRSRKHNLIVSNIANMDTPRYQAVDLIFQDQLKKALGGSKSGVMATTHNKHFLIGGGNIKSVKPEVVLSPSVLSSNDQNTVDIEKEMGKLVENNLMYNVAAQILGKKLAAIKNVIKEGGR